MDGQKYDQAAILTGMTKEVGKGPNTTRAPRDAALVCALAGLAYTEKGSAGTSLVRLTPLGRSTMSFLGVGSVKPFINEGNRRLVGLDMLRGITVVVQYRAILALMRLTEDKLSNNELNRCMPSIRSLSSIPDVAEAVLEYRASGHLPNLLSVAAWPPEAVASRAKVAERSPVYNPHGANSDSGADADEDADGDSESQHDSSGERKAMNPHFLIAGGGGLSVSIDRTDPFRQLEPWAGEVLDVLLDQRPALVDSSSAPETVMAISKQSGVSPTTSLRRIK